jgi:multiple sugar transport system permease protein
VTANLLYAVGTLLTWLGWFLAVKAVIYISKLVLREPGLDRAKTLRDLCASAVGSAVLFIAGAGMPKGGAVASTAPWRLPLTWFVMPFSAWLCAVSIVMIVSRAMQGGLALNPKDKWGRFQASGIWLAVAVLGYWLYKRDPANKIDILNGGISLQPTTAIGIALLLMAATIAMVAAGRASATRGYSKTIVTQAALVAGSIVFGIPFVFLLITSFKEPQDMSSPDGIVWVPKVSQTVPYMDKKDPQYEVIYKGRTVTAHVIERRNDGTAELDILRPQSLAGNTLEANLSSIKEVPRQAKLVQGTLDGVAFKGTVIEEMEDGHERVAFSTPPSMAGKEHVFQPSELSDIRKVGLNLSNYPDALEFLPAEADNGLVYLKNTLILVILNVAGTLLSSSIVAYAFSRMQFPGRNVLFAILLSTMMLPSAVTLLPQFLIWRDLHMIDTLYPLWVTAFFGSAFNIFLLRQFFMQIPMELEDAAKIDGCTYIKTFWDIMLPQIKPALAVIAIWTFMGAWNNFMGPLIYVNSPEHMTLSYGLQLFQGDRGADEPGLVMAFATMCMAPVLVLFFFCQRYFIEGVTLSGLGGR